jgi:hypothetical protein
VVGRSAPCGSCSWSGFPSAAVAGGASRQIHVKGGSETLVGSSAIDAAPGCTAIYTSGRPDAAHTYRCDQTDKGREYEDGGQSAQLCPADVIGRCGRCLSCSDKISRWLACGVQGALLSHFLERPVLLTSVVVGRKYVEARCALALGVSSRIHTKVYGTSVKLEHCKGGDAGERGHSGADGGRGTQGDGDECLSWAEHDQLVGRHDGRTGCALAPAGGRSNVCRAELFKLFARMCAKCSTQGGSWLRLDFNNDEIDSAVFGKSSRSALTAGCAPNAECDRTIASENGPTTKILEMESYSVAKRAAADWYIAARCCWMSESGLATPGD